jgi:hypothetical protein
LDGAVKQDERIRRRKERRTLFRRGIGMVGARKTRAPAKKKVPAEYPWRAETAANVRAGKTSYED